MIKGHWGINDFLGVKGIFFILLNSEGHLGVKEFHFKKKIPKEGKGTFLFVRNVDTSDIEFNNVPFQYTIRRFFKQN